MPTRLPTTLRALGLDGEAIGSAATHPSCEEPLRRSNPGATTCAAPATQTVVLRPLDCFASLAMTDRELAHLFPRVALVWVASLSLAMTGRSAALTHLFLGIA